MNDAQLYLSGRAVPTLLSLDGPCGELAEWACSRAPADAVAARAATFSRYFRREVRRVLPEVLALDAAARRRLSRIKHDDGLAEILTRIAGTEPDRDAARLDHAAAQREARGADGDAGAAAVFRKLANALRDADLAVLLIEDVAGTRARPEKAADRLLVRTLACAFERVTGSLPPATGSDKLPGIIFPAIVAAVLVDLGRVDRAPSGAVLGVISLVRAALDASHAGSEI